MFASRHRGTVIAKGLKIVGRVTAEGLVEVNGQIEGELHCTSLVISCKAHVGGAITAEQLVVDGTVEGPIQGKDVVLKSQAHVVGDIQHQTLAIGRGAYFEGRSVRARKSNEHRPRRVGRRPLKEAAIEGRPYRQQLKRFLRWQRRSPVGGDGASSGSFGGNDDGGGNPSPRGIPSLPYSWTGHFATG